MTDTASKNPECSKSPHTELLLGELLSSESPLEVQQRRHAAQGEACRMPGSTFPCYEKLHATLSLTGQYQNHTILITIDFPASY